MTPSPSSPSSPGVWLPLRRVVVPQLTVRLKVPRVGVDERRPEALNEASHHLVTLLGFLRHQVDTILATIVDGGKASAPGPGEFGESELLNTMNTVCIVAQTEMDGNKI